MAAVVLVAGSTLLLGAPITAQEARGDRGPQRTESPEPKNASDDLKGQDRIASPPEAYLVELNLLIAGLGRGGCDVEVKPGNRSCRFQAKSQHVASNGKASFVFRDVEIRGAERNCSFGITVREPGQPPKTIYRGFRLAARVAGGTSGQAPQSFTCYVNSPSKLAGLDRTERARQ
jgi:hypothetical protein